MAVLEEMHGHNLQVHIHYTLETINIIHAVTYKLLYSETSK